ncbi:MAG: sulfurtransferase [Planctomycetales bacterium]
MLTLFGLPFRATLVVGRRSDTRFVHPLQESTLAHPTVQMSTMNLLSEATATIVNVAAYKFVSVDNLPERRRSLRALCMQLELKGTILLSPEGINLFIAGMRSAIDALLKHLRSDPLFTDLEVKESLSEHQPFNRMLVRLKKEIVAFGVDSIDPRERRASLITAKTLKAWLDDGRPLTLLDTRNEYEVQLGTFSGAKHLDIGHFREFPEAIKQLADVDLQQPMVMFCTGGIRCEKAGLFAEHEGFQNVFQLEGGILKYFEECGGVHWDGECFVFDSLVSLDCNLRETETRQCYACQALLSTEDQQSDKYLLGISCPYCFQDAGEQMKANIEHRHRQLAVATSPLPGSLPYDNSRPLNVPQQYDQHSLLDFLDQFHPQMGRPYWQQAIDEGHVLHRQQTTCAGKVVRAGERYVHLLPATVEPDVSAEIQILHEDDWLVVINKPAPLPMHPCGRYNRNTLVSFVNCIYKPQCLRAAHRLDANTSGVVIFSRTRAIATVVQRQFESRTVMKTYVARVHGRPLHHQFDSETPIAAQPSSTGIRLPDPNGLPARTEFCLLGEFADGTSLIQARPISGRTNQIRLHLWEKGLPICGDPAYLRDGQLGGKQTLSVDDPPLCLHACKIELKHPHSDLPFAVEAPHPQWAVL